MTPSPTAKVTDAMVEALAEFLCSEFDEDFNPCHGYSWPEHRDDDGYRGGNAYVKLQPPDVQARAREGATRILAFLSQHASPIAAVEAQIGHMVQRFLQWRLPDTFNPDGGISFDQSRRSPHGPVGTNLFDAMQANAMVLHMLDGLPAAIGADGQSYAQIVEPYTAAQRMIRDAIQELFGSVASLESEDATLLRGPEPHHEAEAQIDALMRVRDHIGAGAQAVAELHGPFGWLNGHRALSEDSWTLESDPLENSEEYFAIPLYALVDPFKEIGKDFDGKPALAHPRPLPLKEEVERVLEPFAAMDRPIPIDIPDYCHFSRDALTNWIITVGQIRAARALLSRLRAGAQEGWRLVPVEPTEPMIKAGQRCSNPYNLYSIWSAMIAAAPSPAKEGER